MNNLWRMFWTMEGGWKKAMERTCKLHLNLPAAIWTRAFSLWGADHYATAVIIYNMLKTSSVWDDVKTVMINQLSKNWKESKSKKKQTWHLLILQLEL